MLDPVKNRLLMSQLREVSEAERKTVIDKRTLNRIIRSKISKISSEADSRGVLEFTIQEKINYLFHRETGKITMR